MFAVEDAIGHYEQARSLLQEQQWLQTILPASAVEHLYVCLGRASASGRRRKRSGTRPRSRPGRGRIPLKSALPHGQHALSLARGIHDKELEARCLSLLGVIHLRGGGFQEAIHCVEASLALYAALGSEPTASRELSLPSLTIDSPLTQPLTNRASEALCWAFLSLAQVHVGQVQSSIRSGRRALALSQRARTPGHKSAVRSASRMACWTRGIMKRRSGSRSTPSR